MLRSRYFILFVLALSNAKIISAVEPPSMLQDVPFSHSLSQEGLKHVRCSYNKPGGEFMGPHDAFSVSQDGKIAIAGEYGWSIWDAATRKRICKGKTAYHPRCDIAISDDGKWLAFGGAQIIPQGKPDEAAYMPAHMKLYDARSGALLASLGGHPHRIYKVAFTRNGRYFVSLSTERLRVTQVADCQTLVCCKFKTKFGEPKWNFERPSEKAKLRIDHDITVDVFRRHDPDFAISPDGQTIALSIGKSRVFFLETLTGKLVGDLACKEITKTGPLTFAPDGSHLAVAAEDKGLIEIWRIGDAKKFVKLLGGQPCDSWSLAFSPNSQWLLSGGQDGARVWDVSSGECKHWLRKELATLRDPEPIPAVAFLPNGNTFAVLTTLQVVRFWDLATGKEVDPTKLRP